MDRQTDNHVEGFLGSHRKADSFAIPKYILSASSCIHSLCYLAIVDPIPFLAVNEHVARLRSELPHGVLQQWIDVRTLSWRARLIEDLFSIHCLKGVYINKFKDKFLTFFLPLNNIYIYIYII